MGNRDIDIFISEFLGKYPQVESWQLEVMHPADDDGIWYFQAGKIRFHVESSDGNFPFVVESNIDSNFILALSFEHLYSLLENGLGLKTSKVDPDAS
jgi:hypothetical protein